MTQPWSRAYRQIGSLRQTKLENMVGLMSARFEPARHPDRKLGIDQEAVAHAAVTIL